MKMIKYYLAVAAIFILFAVKTHSLFLAIICAWTALSIIVVCLAYIFNFPKIFRKRSNGKIPTSIRWFFFPFLLGASLYNAFKRKFDKVPPVQRITDTVYLACRLFPSDVDSLKKEGVTAILDVTAEFDGLDWSAEDANLAYLNIPVLDHETPTEQELLQAISWIDEQVSKGGKVVIHCALGRGRSVFVTCAYLLSRDNTLSVIDAMNQIQSTRQTARLNKRQLAAMQKIKKGGRLKLMRKLVLVANPVSGGGKWQDEKDFILERLSSHFEVEVKLTSKDTDGQALAQAALDEGAEVVVACGGDGTLREVAEAMAGQSAVMGVIPLGTANALSMVLLGSTSKLTPVSSACDIILAEHVTRIDTAVCNDKRSLLVCGIGVEAQMIKRSDRSQKDEKGQLAYLQYFAESLVDAEAQEYSISIDDQASKNVHTQSLVIANAAPPSTVLAQGGGNPDVTDGLLDVNWFKNLDGLVDKLGSVAGLTVNGLLDGKHEDAVEFTRCQKITVQADRVFDFVLDGEVYQSDRIQMHCEPGSLNMLCDPESVNAS